MKKQYLLITLSLLFVINSFAQAPEKLSYQALVRDNSDMLLTSQNIGMQISILQTSAVGSAVYVETQNPTTNANGLVSIQIGNGSVVSGDFAAIDWSSDTYFIKTEIDINGGTNYTITGTSQLLSVPYALHAKTAESITGTLNENDPVFTSSAANSISSSDITSWNNKLDTEVDGSITNEIELPTGGNDGQILKTDGSGNYAWVDHAAGTDKQINFNDAGSLGADSELVYDKSSNHMAIGSSTVNPNAALEVSSTTGALLLPRMTTAQRDLLTASEGMILFNTTTHKVQTFLSGGNYSEGNSVGVSFGYSDSAQGNTFQIANTATLNTISVSIANPAGNPITGSTVYSMKVYDSQGGSLLATASNTFNATPGGYTGGNFDFSSSALTLTANTTY